MLAVLLPNQYRQPSEAGSCHHLEDVLRELDREGPLPRNLRVYNGQGNSAVNGCNETGKVWQIRHKGRCSVNFIINAASRPYMITYRAYLFGFGINVSFMLVWNYLVKVNALRYWQKNSGGFFSLFSQRNTVTKNSK